MRKKISPDELIDFAVTSRSYRTLLTTKYKNRKIWEKPNPNNLYSYIPGTIVKVDVKEGEIVEAGKTLATLEAMKMLNKIQMPFNGKIKHIYIAKGMRIPKNFLMMEIEEEMSNKR